jgi:hypothetical protein
VDTQRVVVVSQRLADRFWPGRDPIGQHLLEQDTLRPDLWRVVVGVAGPVLHHELDAAPRIRCLHAGDAGAHQRPVLRRANGR